MAAIFSLSLKSFIRPMMRMSIFAILMIGATESAPLSTGIVMTDRIRVLIVDDQPRARQSVTALLATDPHIEDVRQASSGDEALRLMEQSLPDLVLLDARMPDMDGIAVTFEIKQRWPRIKVIVLSLYTEYRNAALAAGADAFVSKGDPPNDLLFMIGSLT